MSELVAPKRSRLLLAQWAELMEDDSFRRFWFMRLFSHGATNALGYTLLVFTIRHSPSAVATGFLLLTMIVPSAFLGALAGVAVDRLPRGLILFLANLLRAVLVFVLIGAKDTLPGIYAVSFGLGIITQFAAPAEGATVPDVVRQKRLLAANSFINLGTLASQVLGMLVLAPIFLKTTNGDALLFILIGLFAASALLVTVIPQFHFVTTRDQGRISLPVMRREFAEGWLRVSRDATAFLGLVLLVATSTSILIIATLLPKFSAHVLDIAPENIVFVLAPVVVGVVMGLRSVEFIADRYNKLVTISAAYILMAASLIALGLVPASAAVIRGIEPLGLFGDDMLGERGARILATVLYANTYCFALTVVLTMGRVLINERIPMEMQGRVFAAQAVLANLSAILPVVLAGLLADAIGVEPVLVIAGIGALLAAGWSQARSSRVFAPAADVRPAERVGASID